MQEKPKGSSKNLFVIGAIVVAVGAACYFYATRDRSPDAAITAIAGAAPIGADAKLVSTLNDLKHHNLDDSIFKDPVWLSLVDSSKSIDPQDPYRQNPFAPLGASLAGTSTLPQR